MILYNSGPHPTPEAESAISRAFQLLGQSSLDVAIWLRSCFTYTYQGRTYNGVPSMSGFVHAKAMRFLVVVELLDLRSERAHYPIPILDSIPKPGHLNSARATAVDWPELLSWAIGHEIYHIERFRRGKHHDERGADLYGDRTLRDHRQRATVIDTGASTGLPSPTP